jgi:SpoIID/LytB domain protein
MRKNARTAGHRFAAAWLALLLLWQTAASSESLSSVSVESAPLTTAAAAQNGMVRVYLSSLGTPSMLNLTVAGNYSLSTGTTLTSGESLAIGFSSTTGAITVTRGGVKTNMGLYFTLRRHSASGSNGILISQARKPANPYPGDISFRSVASGSGYKLYTVAHIYIENYLYGVLPYEMGSGAPAEALKAQAVAARTYTVRMKASRTGGYYDVVDTTSDQVYNGTPSGNSACEAAVNATKGIVLKNSGVYTATYYSASNGGQTESIQNIWGTAGLSYLSVKDDPFDYANPDSVVKKATVYADATSSLNSANLMNLLKTKAVAGLSAAGYAATTANTTLQTVKSIAPHTPMYASPSKLYTKMDFTLAALTKTTSGGTATATVTVTCGIFTELESLLSMSIQSGKNELWSVVKSGTAFMLQARRYGHGLGLSQRGAMYMGKLGYTYDKILGFYFDGSTRVGCTFTNTILAAGSTEEIVTEENAADIVDSDTGDGATGIVKLASSTGLLAIRASKSTSGAMLGVVSASSPVSVYTSDGTWCLIGFGAIVGYVPQSALTISGTPPETSTRTVSAVEGFATVTASGYLNLRASGSYTASVLTTAPTGAVLTVFSRSGGWARVQYGATAAYASMDYLRFSDTYTGAAASSGSTTAYVTVESGQTAPLQQTASTSGTVLSQLSAGTAVSVTRDDGSWAYVTVGSQSGYLRSDSLTYSDEVTPVDGGDEPEPDTEATATVSATVGILYESADETSAVILSIAMGQTVVLVGVGDTWTAVRYEGVTGYMRTASLNLPQSETGVTATVSTQSGSLNMRKEARAGSAVVTTIPRGASVMVTSRGETWSAVTYAGYSGYAMTAFLLFAGDSDTQDGEPVSTTATVTTQSGSLNLRQLPKAGSTILRTIPQYATVGVYQYGAQWCGVTYGVTSGYAMTAFLTLASETATPTPSPAATPTDTVTETPTDTATDTPSPTPTATGGGITAIVSTASGSLNLRADMLPGSRILARIPKGTTLAIMQKLSAWSETTYAGYTGYVMNNYLTFLTDTQGTEGDTTTATVMTASGSLNLRAEPYGKVLLAMPQYAAVLVLSRGGGWCRVQYGTVTGYAMTAYLAFGDATAATATPAPTAALVALAATATETDDTAATASPAAGIPATVYTPSGSLNLRADKSTSAQIITTIPRLSTVTVLEKGETWCSVLYGATAGYVQTAYLRFADETEAQATATPTATTAPAAETGITAWVMTASGSLNLRDAASTSGTVLTAIPRLAQVTITSQGATWCGVRYASYTGYAMTAYLTTTRPAEATTAATSTAQTAETQAPQAATPTEDPTLYVPDITLPATITPRAGGTTLTLWAACTQETGQLMEMLAGAQVQVVRVGETWCEVVYFGQTGFCLREGLTLLEQ